jgi:hypothetical protein
MNREALWRLVVDAKYNVQVVVGALRRQWRHLELEFGNILEGGGISSPLLSRWGLGRKLVFGMIFGVGIDH